MLLESALAELRIDLDDEMYFTSEGNADSRNGTAMVLQMSSPEVPKPNRKQKEFVHNEDTQPRDSSPLHNSYRAPGKVPFRWEIEPGVPKPEAEPPQRPLRLPPSAYGAAILSPSPGRSRRRRTAGYFPWNSSSSSSSSAENRGSIHRHALSEGQFQFASIILRDDTSSNSEFDSSEGPSPVSTLESYGSPARSLSSLDDRSPTSQFQLSPMSSASPVLINAGTLSAFMVRQNRELAGSNRTNSGERGVFPSAGKCFPLPNLKSKGKAKQSVWSKAGSQKKSLPSGSSNADDNILAGSHKVFRIPSAMKKQQGGNSIVAAMKQVRFSEGDDDATRDPSPFSNRATVAASDIEWASYGLF